MDSFLAEQGLRLTYLRDPSQSEAFDPCRILDDLCNEGMGGAMLPWQNGLRMAGSDHLVIATGTDDGRCFGVVAASDMATDREPFLFLDAAYMAPTVRTSHLLQRMLAFAMLRISGFSAVPYVVAACVQTPCYARSLREFGERFTLASLFPAAQDAVVIDLGMASLARRIVRIVRPMSRHAIAGGFRSVIGGVGHYPSGSNPNAGSGGNHRMEETLVVIDLSMADDTTIIDDARRVYRSRPRLPARRGLVGPIGSEALRAAQARPGATAL